MIGFSIAGFGVALIIMFAKELTLLTMIMAILFIIYGSWNYAEIRQNKNYGKDPEYQKYVKSTPILLPFVPLYSVAKYKWLVG